MPRKLRLAGAVLLVCAVFLPLSECSRHEDQPPPVPKSFSARLFPRSDANFDYRYGVDYLEFKPFGFLTAFAFAWPLLFVFFDGKRRGPKGRWMLFVLELLLCAGSAYWIHAIMLGGRWLYGAYVALAAILSFAAGAVLLFQRGDGRFVTDKLEIPPLRSE